MPKKLKNLVVQKMLAIPKIRAEMQIFVDEELMPMHQIETSWKLRSLNRRWQITFSQKAFDLFNQVCKVIETDPKFKLPWTNHEVNIAIDYVTKLDLHAS